MEYSPTRFRTLIFCASLACIVSAPTYSQEPAPDPCGCDKECPEPVGYVAPKMGSSSNFPNKPLVLVVPYPPGGSADTGARRLAQKLSKSLGQTVVVDNKGGAGGVLGAESVAGAAPDGYTILYTNSTTFIINSHLQRKDVKLEPVALVSEQPYVLVVNSSLNAKNVDELIAYAKSKPGVVSFASTGVGNLPHLAAEMFKQATQTDVMVVPYKGSVPAIIDLLSGNIQAAILPAAQVEAGVARGKLRVLAVTGKMASSLPAGTRPLSAAIPGYVVRSWTGVMIPQGTSQEIVNTLNMHINIALADRQLAEQFKDDGETVCGTKGPKTFGAHLGAERRKWPTALDRLGIRSER